MTQDAPITFRQLLEAILKELQSEKKMSTTEKSKLLVSYFFAKAEERLLAMHTASGDFDLDIAYDDFHRLMRRFKLEDMTVGHFIANDTPISLVTFTHDYVLGRKKGELNESKRRRAEIIVAALKATGVWEI